MFSLTEKIKRKAARIGFHKIGVVRAENLKVEGEHLREWLEKDFHGEMQWLEREPEKRSDPQILFRFLSSNLHPLPTKRRSCIPVQYPGCILFLLLNQSLTPRTVRVLTLCILCLYENAVFPRFL